MPDAAATRELLARHHRWLAHFLRSLLPDAGEAESAWRETALRISRRGHEGPAPAFGGWAEQIAGQVANERRKAAPRASFSDDLFRQLADSSGPAAEKVEARARALAECLLQLPPPERELLRKMYGLGLTAEQIAAAEHRPPATVARDLAGLHGSLIGALQAQCPDGGPDPPGGAADLGRLAGQLLDGTISDDSRLVLETLLLADTPAQAHYRRHVALVTDLTWIYRGTPALPELPATNAAPLSRRELAVTIAFVAACAIVLGLVVIWFTGVFR